MKNIFITTLLFLTVVFCSAQEKYVPSQENLTNREWFRDAKFGMFIHWGIYSMLADGEWVLTNKSLNEAEYQKLADGFYPSKFNADEWVRIAKDAGMKYIPPAITTGSRCSTRNNRITTLSKQLLSNEMSSRNWPKPAKNTDLNYSSTIPISTGTDRIITRGGARDGTRDVLLPARGKII